MIVLSLLLLSPLSNSDVDGAGDDDVIFSAGDGAILVTG
jgi:hypothetical protein